MLRWGLENCFYFFIFFLIDGEMLWFLSCDKCTYCKLHWTKVSAKCKCKTGFEPTGYDVSFMSVSEEEGSVFV